MLVGHTHFDHAVDAPAIARRIGCKAYGSDSLLNLMALHGLAERTVEVEPYRTYELGPFEVSFTPSVHSKLLLGLAVPYDGELTCEHLDALSPGAYRCGQVWGISIAVAGLRFYHQGSANLIDEAVRERDVDVFLAGVAGRGFTDDYWQRILPRLNPRAVVPTHYDNFFRPLGQDLEFVTDVQLCRAAGGDRRRQPRHRARGAAPARDSPRRLSRQPQYLAAICSIVPIVRRCPRRGRLLDRLQVELGLEQCRRSAASRARAPSIARQVLVGGQRQHLLARRRASASSPAARPGACPSRPRPAFAANGSWAAIAATSAQLRRKTGTS